MAPPPHGRHRGVLSDMAPLTVFALFVVTLLLGALIGNLLQPSLPAGLPPGSTAQAQPLARTQAPDASAASESSSAPRTDVEAAQALVADQGGVRTETFEQLLTSQSGLSASQTKHGMLPTALWHHSGADAPSVPAFCRHAMCDQAQADRAFSWIWQSVSSSRGAGGERLAIGTVPPKAALCTVLFSPAYKVAFIRGTKVGGTSMLLGQGGRCPSDLSWAQLKKRPFCYIDNKQMQEIGVETLGYASWEELWADYTIFTMVRNPYDRAGSSYDYLLDRHEAEGGMCAAPTFDDFCARPYILGMQDLLFDCGDAIHDLYHVEPQAPCLVDDAGDINFDAVIRLENLEEDYAALAEVINGRRAAGLPEVVSTVGWLQKGPDAKTGKKSNRHLPKYEDCGARCFDFARAYFADDFRLLQYPAVL